MICRWTLHINGGSSSNISSTLFNLILVFYTKSHTYSFILILLIFYSSNLTHFYIFLTSFFFSFCFFFNVLLLKYKTTYKLYYYESKFYLKACKKLTFKVCFFCFLRCLMCGKLFLLKLKITYRLFLAYLCLKEL